MNRDVIERLAIDSAAGELNEDAEALFQSYLDEHQLAKRWADAVREIYDKTEAAVRTKLENPASDGMAHADHGMMPADIKPASLVRWIPIARWAAVLVLGAIIGFTAGRWEMPVNTHRMAFQRPNRDSKPIEAVTDLKEKYVGTFWGDKMLALLEHQSSGQHQAGHLDIRSWDTYRQYMKDKHNE